MCKKLYLPIKEKKFLSSKILYVVKNEMNEKKYLYSREKIKNPSFANYLILLRVMGDINVTHPKFLQ